MQVFRKKESRKSTKTEKNGGTARAADQDFFGMADRGTADNAA